MSDELSPSEAATQIGATTRTVQRWIAKGVLPARRVGGRWRVAIGALDALMAPGAPAGATARSTRGPSPIATLFVANRGEIAARIRRTADRLGIRTIVPGEDDVPATDLLDIAAVIESARTAHADAVHPGYGFLAESAAFATAVETAGMSWIGPPPDAMRALGDKASARRFAASLDIPIVPGYDDADRSDSALATAAERIGLPLVVKPAAGGGGKGMRVVRDMAHLADAFASARREALSAFGDDRLVLERFLEGARHVEIQVLFDGHGAGVHLGERECSLQRRQQKILEETPAPGLDPDTRQQMAAAAIHLAQAVGYRSAGTCEFLVDDHSRFYFLEMNTRLQVEHPVTEAVTGRDLIADQLAIAAGASLTSLGLDQASVDAVIATGGHAVEVRLYAEDAEHGFLPVTGRVEVVLWPGSMSRFGPASPTGIRIDAGFDAGTEVGPRFDPMLAKVVAHGGDREDAFDRLGKALDELAVLGLVTNLRFLRWLVRAPVVRGGLAHTDTLERVWPPDGWSADVEITAAAWTEAALLLSAPLPGDPAADAYAGGWRLNGSRRIRIATDDEERSVALGTATRPAVAVAAAAEPFASVRRGAVVHLDLGGRSTAFRLASPPDVDQAVRAAAHGQAGVRSEVLAPMPGNVLTVHVAPGDTISTGDPVATLEAMKMEHVVVAPGAGRIGEVLVRPADQVVRGQRLATIEPHET